MDIGFAPNYTNLYLIDTTPTAPKPTWAYLGPGIATIEPDDEDQTDDKGYYDGGGAQAEDVTGVKLGYTVEGDRRYGDPAQDYIRNLRTQTGEARRTNLMHVEPDGNAYEGEVIVKDIKIGGGDANDKGGLEFGMTFAKAPKITEPTKTQMPEEVTLEDVTVAEGATVEAKPTVTPESASGWCVYAIKDHDVARVDGMGNVTGVKQGETEMTVKCVAKPTVSKTVKVTVSGAD